MTGTLGIQLALQDHAIGRGVQPLGNGLDKPGLSQPVLPLHAIATADRRTERATSVHQSDGDAVDLGLNP